MLVCQFLSKIFNAGMNFLKIGVQRLPQGFPKKIFAAALVVSPGEKCARPRAAAEKMWRVPHFFALPAKPAALPATPAAFGGAAARGRALFHREKKGLFASNIFLLYLSRCRIKTGSPQFFYFTAADRARRRSRAPNRRPTRETAFCNLHRYKYSKAPPKYPVGSAVFPAAK